MYPLFAVAGGRRRFPQRRAASSYLALNNLDLEVSKGEHLAVIGPNGSGKTTLLRVISGIFKPSVGSVSTKGSVSTILDSGYGFDPHATGRQNAILRALLNGFTHYEGKKYAAEIQDFSGLEDFFDQPIRTYSTGMLARLSFTVSTQWPSDILVIDEGFQTADASFQQKAEARIADILHQSQTIILASHSKTLVTTYCEKAVILQNGRVTLPVNLDKALEEYPL